MKTTVRDIYNYIDSIAPFALTEEWDNCGLLVGDFTAPVARIGLVLDITNEVIDLAREAEIGLLVSHHPVIFPALGSLPAASPAYRLAQLGIHAICAHSSLDHALVNDALAAKLGLREIQPIPGAPLLRQGVLPKALSAGDFAAAVSAALGAEVRCSRVEKSVRRVAVCGGSGKEFLQDAAAGGADAYITGDAGHHDFLDAAALDILLLAAGHYETEQPVIPALAQKIQAAFPGLSITVLPQESPICI